MAKNRLKIEDLVKKGFVADSNGVWSVSIKGGTKVSETATSVDLGASKSVLINIKPLSVNEAFKGRRFKTRKYKEFEERVLSVLPPLNLPLPPYCIFFRFGFSSKASDWDNCIKQTQDCLAKKYKFNDKLIRKGIVETEIVPKGCEYFLFSITHLESKF